MPFSSYSCLKKTNRDMRSFFASSNCESIGAVLEFTGQYSSDYSVQFAVMALIAAPAVIVFAFLNKHITKGVAMGITPVHKKLPASPVPGDAGSVFYYRQSEITAEAMLRGATVILVH